MDCRQVKDILVPYILGDLDAVSRQSRELEAHLQSCKACSEEYEDNKRTVEFIETHKAEFAEALDAIEYKEAARAAEENPISAEELERSWRCIETKIDKHEAAEKREKHASIRRILVKVSAAAACLSGVNHKFPLTTIIPTVFL